MKRDLNLVNKILCFVESCDPLQDGEECYDYDMEEDFPGHTYEEFEFHLHLMEDAGLIVTFEEAETTFPVCITWDGYDYLDEMRLAQAKELLAQAKEDLLVPTS